MYRDILTNKWILGGLCFLVVFTGVCYLYYQHETAPLKQQATEPNEIIHQSTRNTTAETANRTEQAADAPVGSITPNTEKPITGITAEVENNTEAETQQQTETLAETAVTADVPLSPFGFGPYPEVPDDYIQKLGPPIWMRKIPDGAPDNFLKNAELIGRVLIRLWSDGDTYIVGGSNDADGNVLPHYLDTVYVKITDDTDPPGQTINLRGPPGTGQYHEQIISGDIPSHLTIVTWDDTVGIDPYTFLNLGKE